MLQPVESLAECGPPSRQALAYSPVDRCRICSSRLIEVADFGEHALGSRFPGPDEPDAPVIPLTLCRCPSCSLVQLGQRVNGAEIWRDGYGYASGVNETMRAHLANIVERLDAECAIRNVVLDIGCNDGTLLREWQRRGAKCIGFDPIASPLEGATIVRGYFSAREYQRLGLPPADVVTSIAMFYDLDDPVSFAADVRAVMSPRGVWCLEVGYLGSLVDGAWDGICHEHVAYYGLRQIAEIAKRAGFVIRRVIFNKVNGGSLQVWLAQSGATQDTPRLIAAEAFEFSTFAREVQLDAKAIRRCIRETFKGRTVYALGASTKGNTILQTACLDRNDIAAAVDRNPDKVGRRLPGTGIPIISEDEARANPPDAFLVLPWHFREQLLERERELRKRGVKFIFPLPRLEIC